MTIHRQRIPYHSYPVDVIRRAIQLVTGAMTSLRGAAKCLRVFSDVVRTAIPSHTAIQNWVLQYGLYELNAPIERRTDWIFVLDHTIEFGPQKCLLILGISMQELAKNDAPVTLGQVRVLRVEISRTTSGQQIHQVLTDLIVTTGVPVQIVSDGGSDLKKAIELTRQQFSTIRTTYDITHKCGLILNHLLDHDLRWRRFQDQYAYTKRKCVHSSFAFIAPKKLNDKSRWCNLDTCIDWARKVIHFRETITQRCPPGRREANEFIRKFDQTFGWINDFAESIRQWSDMLHLISIARDEVKTHGLRCDSAQKFHEKITQLPIPSAPAESVRAQLHLFLQQQTFGISSNEKFLGTSDIIESLFAKYKNFSARTPMKGIGKAILSIPVFMSNITADRVANALQQVKTKSLTQWLATKIGESIFAQRKKAFASLKPM